MSEENIEQVEEPTNALELSDEDFANLDFSAYNDSPVDTETVEESIDEVIEEDISEDASEEAEEEIVDEATETTEEEEESSEETQEASDEEEVVEESEESDTVTEDDESESTIDYKAAYEQLTKPFKANGKEIKVDNVEDAVTLMQMGANYNKKMAGLKPNLKLLKMLENNKLLDESKLSYLIDLDKKDPEAIKKLIKDAGVDPLDIDTNTPSEYKPNAYNVSDNEVELDEILDEIRDTTSFSDTVDVISNKWDNSSKQIVLDNPDVIRIINDHMESGVYQQINTIVESERMLGRLKGMSDIEAYKHVGDVLNSNGEFNKGSRTNTETPKAGVKKAVDPKLKAKKKAASSTKTTAKKQIEPEFNPLSLSDEELEKMDFSKFM